MKIIIDHDGKVHRQQPEDPTKGASLQAKIGVTYDKLLEVFGEPTAVCQEADVPLGIFGTDAEAVKPYIDKGFTLIAVGTDTLMLGQAGREILSGLR